MTWLADSLNQLAAGKWGYDEHGPAAVEPCAIAALALVAHDNRAATRAGQWLAARQAPAGHLGVDADEAEPHWPTALAILAWRAIDDAWGVKEFQINVTRAMIWLLSVAGKAMPRSPEVGHDTTLVGWPWVEGTHSWTEPTAMALLALKATGNAQHPRAREGARLLIDRLLPDGGCNTGNTQVLGNWLRPHVHSSGVAALALAGETDGSGRLSKTIDYLARHVGASTTASSLAMGLMGLAAHERLPEKHLDWLTAAAERCGRWPGSLARRAQLALAAAGSDGPLVKFARQEAAE